MAELFDLGCADADKRRRGRQGLDRAAALLRAWPLHPQYARQQECLGC